MDNDAMHSLGELIRASVGDTPPKALRSAIIAAFGPTVTHAFARKEGGRATAPGWRVMLVDDTRIGLAVYDPGARLGAEATVSVDVWPFSAVRHISLSEALVDLDGSILGQWTIQLEGGTELKLDTRDVNDDYISAASALLDYIGSKLT